MDLHRPSSQGSRLKAQKTCHEGATTMSLGNERSSVQNAFIQFRGWTGFGSYKHEGDRVELLFPLDHTESLILYCVKPSK